MEAVDGPATSIPAGLVPSLLPPSDNVQATDSISVSDLVAEERRKNADLLAFLYSVGHSAKDLARFQSDGGGVASVTSLSPAVPVDNRVSPVSSASWASVPARSLGPSVVPFGRDISNSNFKSAATVSPASASLFAAADFPALSPVAAGGLISSQSHSRGAPLLSAHPMLPSAPLSSGVCTAEGRPVHSWSRVAGETSSPDRSLSFFPPAPTDGEVIIKPPVDLLRHGNSLWATSLIGGFLHSRLPFKQVEGFALKVWGGLGFQKVFLHAKGYFIFKFSSAEARDNVMALGPWYLSNKLLLLSHWKDGADPLKESLAKVPVWVKLHNVPYAYWTSEGLSYLASGLGKPLFMDAMTAKLEPLPFARVCIEISAGSKMPDKLFATILDADSGEESLIEVQVVYQSKPKACGFCSSFGHSQLKCPRANYQWVPKVSDPSSDGVEVVDSSAGNSPMVAPMESAVTPKGGLPKAFPKGFLSKARPKADPPKAIPKGVLPKGRPEGDLLKSCLKGGPPKDLQQDVSTMDQPKGFSPMPLLQEAVPTVLPIPHLPPRGCSPDGSAEAFRAEEHCTRNPFDVLRDDQEAVVTDDEPPSWGPLVRRLKAIDEKDRRALLSVDVVSPLRAQQKSKKKKKKSPKGK